MKKQSRWIPLVLFLFIHYYSCLERVGGNGEIITTQRISDEKFDSISLSAPAKLYLHSGRTNKITLDIDSNLEKHVETSISNGELLVRIVPQGVSIQPTQLVLNVSMPSVSALHVSGSGQILLQDPFQGEEMDLQISGSGVIHGHLEGTHLRSTLSGSGSIILSGQFHDAEIDLSGSGKMESRIYLRNLEAHIGGSGQIILTGSSNESQIEISGSGKLEALPFEMRNATIKISGSGEAYVNVLNSLEGRISGSGKIWYRGRPILNYHGTGSGTIIPWKEGS